MLDGEGPKSFINGLQKKRKKRRNKAEDGNFSTHCGCVSGWKWADRHAYSVPFAGHKPKELRAAREEQLGSSKEGPLE